MNIVIIDDHQLFLESFCQVLEDTLAAKVTAFMEAQSALLFLQQHRDVDLILMDLSMPDMDGHSLLHALTKSAVMTPVVVLSANEDPLQIRRVLDAGAVAFIPKTHSVQETIHAIRQVWEKGTYLPESLRQAVRSVRKDMQIKLSRRQTEVLSLMAKGASNQEISDTLGISTSTVKSHAHTMFGILQVNNRTECVARARELKLIQTSID